MVLIITKSTNMFVLVLKIQAYLIKLEICFMIRYRSNKSFGVKSLEKVTWNRTRLELYEAKIPPLLKFFHIKKISPSGWIEIPKKNKNKTKDNVL